uniref:Putative secreted protein n=1 Tax=Anopheles darlingi TaxID=43151 RepID=A0A2M4DHY7_ANODA
MGGDSIRIKISALFAAFAASALADPLAAWLSYRADGLAADRFRFRFRWGGGGRGKMRREHGGAQLQPALAEESTTLPKTDPH